MLVTWACSSQTYVCGISCSAGVMKKSWCSRMMLFFVNIFGKNLIDRARHCRMTGRWSMSVRAVAKGNTRPLSTIVCRLREVAVVYPRHVVSGCSALAEIVRRMSVCSSHIDIQLERLAGAPYLADLRVSAGSCKSNGRGRPPVRTTMGGSSARHDVPGWFDFEALYEQEVRRVHEGTFVEVGTYLGRSAAYLAERIKVMYKPIRFFAVDTFDGGQGARQGQLCRGHEIGRRIVSGTVDQEHGRRRRDRFLRTASRPVDNGGRQVSGSQLRFRVHRRRSCHQKCHGRYSGVEPQGENGRNIRRARHRSRQRP